MTQLTVKAEAVGGGLVPPGSLDEAYVGAPILAVSVTTTDAAPVSGLSGNFGFSVLFDEQANPAFKKVTPTLVKKELPGIYVFGLVPHSGPNKDHKYLYIVHVKRTVGAVTDQGQTLTSLMRFLP